MTAPLKCSGNAEDMVLRAKGASMPRNLYIHVRRLLDFYWRVALWPVALLVTAAFVPSAFLWRLATLFDGLIWSQLKPVPIGDCAQNCWLAAFGLVAVPITWLSAVAIGLFTIPLAVRSWQAEWTAYDNGATPRGRRSDGTIRRPPGVALSAFGAVLSALVLVGLELLLTTLAGSTQTNLRGRSVHPAMISIWLTIVMGITQLLSAVVFAALTMVVESLNKPRRL